MTTNNQQLTLTHDPQQGVLDNFGDLLPEPPPQDGPEPLFGTHIREATETLRKLFR